MMYGSPQAKDLNRPFHHHHPQQQQQQQMSSGLLRYRSAPISFFGEVCEHFLPVRPSVPDTETMFARFLPPDLPVHRGEIYDKPPPPDVGGWRKLQFPPPLPPVAITEENVASAAAFSSAAALYQQQQQQQQIASNLAPSMAMEADRIKNRHSCPPAGLFPHLNVDNGCGVVRRGVGGFRNGNEGLKSQLSFSYRRSSPAAPKMSQISEEVEEDQESSMEGYPVAASWEESPLSSGGGGGLKIQNGQVRSGPSHQFSSPKSSSEMAAIEKFLQFHDSVPCKIRAKRGCATHPRSIAERVRRTRISERMRKLQEVVPNMDKQTNTADMLDLAVDYIKDLRKQAKTLSDGRTSCTCSSSKPNPNPNSTS
ncbi:putative receptor-like protein kinase [Iris pallida]|uniref:Receptor-like protein kinase n=1 Tax=Iris pallida TaxID=29817 RepID=A0AAX6FR51_IRIPA|nr:putative receptor-like protein kinase [Iris pallida]